jgi:hypothetical protein
VEGDRVIVVNHQPQFLPYLGFFHKVAHGDLLVMLDDVQFQERGFQHRNVIKMQTGKQWLTVPVRQSRGQLIKDVVIDPQSNWRKKHWAALVSNYSPAPFFKQHAPSLEPILVQGTHTRLVDLDIELLRWAFAILEIDVPIRLSSELGLDSGDANDRHIAICKAVGADTYLSGPGGKEYMVLEQYEQAGVRVEFQDYKSREYPQLCPKHGFIANVAVVDAIFNLGPAARELVS